MEIGETLLVHSREEWRAWLAEHGQEKKEIWLIYYKKKARMTGIPSITYEEAVEEALCSGWIDNMSKGIDAERYAVRFAPRRRKSSWTATNRALAARFIREGRMTEAGLAVLPADLIAEATEKENGAP